MTLVCPCLGAKALVANCGALFSALRTYKVRSAVYLVGGVAAIWLFQTLLLSDISLVTGKGNLFTHAHTHTRVKTCTHNHTHAYVA